jgi:site-specific DNA-methyltransferase (adenine-specific)
MKSEIGPDGIIVLRQQDVIKTLSQVRSPITTTILDPWYNKGIGGSRTDYDDWLSDVLRRTALVSDHIFLWGFPEIIYRQLDRLPEGVALVTWLTWFYKNCPSVIRGWRSAQFTCLHLSKLKATLYPEHFLNDIQQKKREQGKLRYMPGPSSVLEVPLNIGFVGRAEQTGHPAQKPMAVIKPLVMMTTKPGDTVLDPMCGSGTTGAVCRQLGRRAILCDASDDSLKIVEKRLHLRRQRMSEDVFATS